jgi:hypothetical protein
VLLERFQSEGLIEMDKDMKKFDKRAIANNSMVNQVITASANLNHELNLAGETA